MAVSLTKATIRQCTPEHILTEAETLVSNDSRRATPPISLTKTANTAPAAEIACISAAAQNEITTSPNKTGINVRESGDTRPRAKHSFSMPTSEGFYAGLAQCILGVIVILLGSFFPYFLSEALSVSESTLSPNQTLVDVLCLVGKCIGFVQVICGGIRIVMSHISR